MSWGYGFNSNPNPIHWVTTSDELDTEIQPSMMERPTVLATHKVVDHTCDKVHGNKGSLRKAEELLEKKRATKKHAKCEMEIVETNLSVGLVNSLADVYGTPAFYKKIEQVGKDYRKQLSMYPIVCEQKGCQQTVLDSGNGVSLQYYCEKCAMNLCPICIFEHSTFTSISGKTCKEDGLLLQDTGKINGEVVEGYSNKFLPKITIRKTLGLKMDMTLDFIVKEIKQDSNTVKKSSGEPLRITRYLLADKDENETEIVLFNFGLADSITENTKVRIHNFRVNMRKQEREDTEYPEGIALGWSNSKIEVLGN